jgi:hypothetical protein
MSQLTFNNCFIESGSGTNYAFANCCCTFNCSFINNQENELGQVVAIDVDDIAFGWQLGNFGLNNSTITVGGNPVSAPFVLGANESLDFSIEFCPGEVGVSDNWVFELTLDGTTVQIVSADFESIDLSNIGSQTTIDFGNVLLNSTETVQFSITNPSICCSSFYVVGSNCTDFIIEPNWEIERPQEICTNQSAEISLSWTPLTLETMNCQFTIGEICSGLELIVNVTGTAVETLPASPVSQKNKVDQTTRVEACSPRTVNNRCQTARTIQSAIRSNARRFGKR